MAVRARSPVREELSHAELSFVKRTLKFAEECGENPRYQATWKLQAALREQTLIILKLLNGMEIR